MTTIETQDAATFLTNEIPLEATYRISSYARRTGMPNSETVTATLIWTARELKDEEVDVKKVEAVPVLVKINGNTLTVEGAEDGTDVSAYSIGGILLGSTTSQNGQASIQFNAQSVSLMIVVKVGNDAKQILLD